MTSPFGVYVHFPYCTHRCNYCDFVLQTPRAIPQRRYTDTLLAEFRLRLKTLRAQGHILGPAQTLYIGGGTPSLWEAAELARFVAESREDPGLSPEAEFTVEANPAQVTGAWLEAMLEIGVNRVSLGVQALRDDLLTTLTRRHDRALGLRAIEMLRAAGLRSWSVDFMFGLPGQTLADWREDLDVIADLNAPHLSIYSLAVESRTVLERQVDRGALAVPSDGLVWEMMRAGRQRLQAAGYAHYEVSSYARPGHRADHNGNYWEMRPYIALGAGAHGFFGGQRWRNLARVRRYNQAIDAGELPTAEVELLDGETREFERIMTGLRRLDVGVHLGASEERFRAAVRTQEALGALTVRGDHIQLTEDGLRLMDQVLLCLLESKAPADPG